MFAREILQISKLRIWWWHWLRKHILDVETLDERYPRYASSYLELGEAMGIVIVAAGASPLQVAKMPEIWPCKSIGRTCLFEFAIRDTYEVRLSISESSQMIFMEKHRAIAV